LFSNLLIITSSDKNYSRNASCITKLDIYVFITFVLSNICRKERVNVLELHHGMSKGTQGNV